MKADSKPSSNAEIFGLPVVDKTLKYAEKDEHYLRRLASALLLQWDSLTDEQQDVIIDQAALVEDRADLPHAQTDIENFVRKVKAVALSKAATAKSEP